MVEIPQDEIRSYATFIVAKHGTDAPRVAAQRSTLLLVQGDYRGAAVWRRVEAMTAEILAEQGRSGKGGAAGR